MRDLRDDGGDPGMVGEEPKVGLDVDLDIDLDKMAKRCLRRRGLMPTWLPGSLTGKGGRDYLCRYPRETCCQHMLDDVFWPRNWSGTKETSTARLSEHIIDLAVSKRRLWSGRLPRYIPKQAEGATGAQMDPSKVRERQEGYCMSWFVRGSMTGEEQGNNGSSGEEDYHLT